MNREQGFLLAVLVLSAAVSLLIVVPLLQFDEESDALAEGEEA